MTFFGLMKKHGKRAYKCVMCDTYCKSVSSFNIHYKTSHPPVKCKRCHQEFSTPNSLKHHMYEHKIKSHKCNNCGKLFSSESQLKDHLKSDCKLKPYPCPWMKNGKRCLKDLNYKGDLNRHLRMHTEPELCCKFCDYKNVDKHNLMQHMRTHGSEEQYKCSKCNCKFRFWMQLKRHTCNK